MRLLIVLFCVLACHAAVAAEPFARASIEGAEGIVAGQQVHVIVDVFAPEFFTSPPQFPLFDVPDALVTLSDDRAQNLVQTIDGVQYAGIRKTYAVVPEKGGAFTLPTIGIDLGFSSDGRPVTTQIRVALPSFDAAPASAGAGAPFAARSLSISQSFDRDPADLKTGDALVRTIVVFAEDTQAMLFPPVDLGDAAGLPRYVKAPVLADGVEQRGIGRNVETGSTRTETVVYTVTSEGRFSLPAISYPWFDLDRQVRGSAELPAVAAVVAAHTSAGERITPDLQVDVPESVSRGHCWIGTVLLLGLIDVTVAVLAWRRFGTVRAFASRLRQAWRTSPRRRLRRLRAVIVNGSDEEIYRGLEEWCRHLEFKSTSQWAEAHKDVRLLEQVGILERRLFRSRDMQLDRRALSEAISMPVTRRRRAQVSALPDLNPTSSSEALLRPL